MVPNDITDCFNTKHTRGSRRFIYNFFHVSILCHKNYVKT